jgi:hypothetical protein
MKKEKNKISARLYRENRRAKEDYEINFIEERKKELEDLGQIIDEAEKDFQEIKNKLYLIKDYYEQQQDSNDEQNIEIQACIPTYYYEDNFSSIQNYDTNMPVQADQQEYFDPKVLPFDLLFEPIPDVNDLMEFQTEKDVSFFKNVPNTIEYNPDASFGIIN